MGKLFGGRWKIVEDIGEGGQAWAYKVQDQRDGSTNWILKRLKNPARLGRFEREVQALEALDSANIAKTEDYSLGNPAFHVSELLGVGLNKYAVANALDTDHALLLFEQIVSAVSDAHAAGVVHRDIKPNNIVVSNDGQRPISSTLESVSTREVN